MKLYGRNLNADGKSRTSGAHIGSQTSVRTGPKSSKTYLKPFTSKDGAQTFSRDENSSKAMFKKVIKERKKRRGK